MLLEKLAFQSLGDFELLKQEAIIKRYSNTSLYFKGQGGVEGAQATAYKGGDLTLTTKRLIWIDKNMFPHAGLSCTIPLESIYNATLRSYFLKSPRIIIFVSKSSDDYPVRDIQQKAGEGELTIQSRKNYIPNLYKYIKYQLENKDRSTETVQQVSQQKQQKLYDESEAKSQQQQQQLTSKWSRRRGNIQRNDRKVDIKESQDLRQVDGSCSQTNSSKYLRDNLPQALSEKYKSVNDAQKRMKQEQLKDEPIEQVQDLHKVTRNLGNEQGLGRNIQQREQHSGSPQNSENTNHVNQTQRQNNQRQHNQSSNILKGDDYKRTMSKSGQDPRRQASMHTIRSNSEHDQAQAYNENQSQSLSLNKLKKQNGQTISPLEFQKISQLTKLGFQVGEAQQALEATYMMHVSDALQWLIQGNQNQQQIQDQQDQAISRQDSQREFYGTKQGSRSIKGEDGLTSSVPNLNNFRQSSANLQGKFKNSMGAQISNEGERRSMTLPKASQSYSHLSKRNLSTSQQDDGINQTSPPFERYESSKEYVEKLAVARHCKDRMQKLNPLIGNENHDTFNPTSFQNQYTQKKDRNMLDKAVPTTSDPSKDLLEAAPYYTNSQHKQGRPYSNNNLQIKQNLFQIKENRDSSLQSSVASLQSSINQVSSTHQKLGLRSPPSPSRRLSREKSSFKSTRQTLDQKLQQEFDNESYGFERKDRVKFDLNFNHQLSEAQFKKDLEQSYQAQILEQYQDQVNSQTYLQSSRSVRDDAISKDLYERMSNTYHAGSNGQHKQAFQNTYRQHMQKDIKLMGLEDKFQWFLQHKFPQSYHESIQEPQGNSTSYQDCLSSKHLLSKVCEEGSKSESRPCDDASTTLPSIIGHHRQLQDNDLQNQLNNLYKQKQQRHLTKRRQSTDQNGLKHQLCSQNHIEPQAKVFTNQPLDIDANLIQQLFNEREFEGIGSSYLSSASHSLSRNQSHASQKFKQQQVDKALKLQEIQIQKKNIQNSLDKLRMIEQQFESNQNQRLAVSQRRAYKSFDNGQYQSFVKLADNKKLQKSLRTLDSGKNQGMEQIAFQVIIMLVKLWQQDFGLLHLRQTFELYQETYKPQNPVDLRLFIEACQHINKLQDKIIYRSLFMGSHVLHTMQFLDQSVIETFKTFLNNGKHESQTFLNLENASQLLKVDKYTAQEFICMALDNKVLSQDNTHSQPNYLLRQGSLDSS